MVIVATDSNFRSKSSIDNRIFDCCYSKKKKNTIIVPEEIISEYVIVINPGNYPSVGK